MKKALGLMIGLFVMLFIEVFCVACCNSTNKDVALSPNDNIQNEINEVIDLYDHEAECVYTVTPTNRSDVYEMRLYLQYDVSGEYRELIYLITEDSHLCISW